MPQDPFPLPPGDAEEPGSSPLPPEPEGDGEDLGQGLYVCLPPEQVTLAGFAQGGKADTMAPGPLLATIVHTVTGQDGAGLAGCSDDQLMGIISAARRMTARAEWTQLAAIAEFARRRDGSRPADEFAADELAFELHLTQPSAAAQMEYSSTVATRLPKTFAALAAGRIHPVHLRIIEEETTVLSDQDAAAADAVLAELAPGMTFGEVRRAARKLVLKLDPEAARKRKEAARGDAHVRPFREDSGNAGMVARELPSDEVLASWQHVEQRALDLRAAGMPGSLRELRVRAYLDLLQERDCRDLPVPSGGADPDQPPPTGEPPTPPDSGPGGPNRHGGPGGRGTGPASAAAPATGPSVAALVNITIPWDTWQGRSQTPGEAAGFGPLDGEDARDLARRRGPPPEHPLVPHRAAPRRHRRRARLPALPPRRSTSPATSRPGPARPTKLVSTAGKPCSPPAADPPAASRSARRGPGSSPAAASWNGRTGRSRSFS